MNKLNTDLKQVKLFFLGFFVLFFLIIFGGNIWGIVGINFHYSDGERSVKIIKLSEKGLIWKTWEAEGVLTQGNVATTYVWEFSVDNKDSNKIEIIKEIKKAFEDGETVKVHYEQRAGSAPWRGETSYFAKEIQF